MSLIRSSVYPFTRSSPHGFIPSLAHPFTLGEGMNLTSSPAMTFMGSSLHEG
jgi:hypothetical protein